MKVEKLNQFKQADGQVFQLKHVGQRAALSGTPGDSVNFTGTAAVDLGEEILKLLPKSDQKFIKFLDKISWFKGEVGGIWTTAIGTGLVAPFSIAFNPFMKPPKDATEEQKKENSNTKKYTAWRQPLSAALSVLFQIGALKPIDKGLDIIFNNPNYAKNLWVSLDQSSLNNKSYIKTHVKEEMSREDLSHLNKKEIKKELERRIKEAENSQIEKVSRAFEETGKIPVGKRFVKDSDTALLINKQIEKYVEDAKELKYSEIQIPFYKQRAADLVNNEKQLTEILSNIPSDEKEIKAYLTEQSAKIEKPEVKKIVDEIIAFPEKFHASKCHRTLDRISTVKKLCDGQFSPEKYEEIMKTSNAEVDKVISLLNKNTISDVTKATPETIQRAIKNTAEACVYDKNNKSLHRAFHDYTETFRTSQTLMGNKVHKDIVKAYKKLTESRYKCFNQVSKILIGVFITLPITCSALNWVYPRFMEIVFPKLAGVKKDKDNAAVNGGEK